MRNINPNLTSFYTKASLCTTAKCHWKIGQFIYAQHKNNRDVEHEVIRRKKVTFALDCSIHA